MQRLLKQKLKLSFFSFHQTYLQAEWDTALCDNGAKHHPLQEHWQQAGDKAYTTTNAAQYKPSKTSTIKLQNYIRNSSLHTFFNLLVM